MAGDSVIGALRVVLGADTAKFEEGLKRATSGLDGFAKRVTTIAAGIGLERVFERLVSEITHSIKKAVEFADVMGKTAQKVGLPVEELTKLRVAAELSDVSMESLSKSLGILSKNIVEAAKGTGEASETFKRLGVEVEKSDGSLKSSNEVLAELAGAFEKTTDGAGKVAAAMTLLGARGGRDLIPLLNEGKESLLEWGRVAERMGLVVLPQTAAQAQKFQDNLKVLKLAQEGVANIVVEALLPAFVRITDQWVDSAKTGDLVSSTAQGIIRNFKELVVVVFQVAAADKILAEGLKAIQDLFVETSIAGTAAQFEKIGGIFGTLKDAMSEARNEALRLFTQITVGAKPTNDLQVATDKVTKTINDLTLKTRELRGDFAALAPGFADQAVKLGLTDEKAKGLALTVGGLTAKQAELNTAMAAFTGAQMLQGALEPWQQFEQQLTRINALYQAGGINAEQAAILSKKAAEETGQAWNIATSSMLGDLASGLQAFEKENKAFAVAGKIAASAQALINTYTAASKALAIYGPTPFGFAAAAAAVVAGLGYVAKINAQNFAAGGSFKVPGGVSGVDTAMVPLNLAAGEQVDITPANKVASQAQVQEIVLTGVRPGDIFTGNTLRELFDALNQGMADGYRLKVAT